ncbi:hypothetical protein, conserved [Eimeria tenella]|uniref:Uncharacterized protein n=1 Tax=Eimeria tenella TaxID=5802 RepID=U6KT30_EIMTE|nr:hypothetical protein, conserved [Eimeria tenella]CDJ40078.1 hypothetical protein, conserved [Eimeria tenella]|eukprot:XP_013230831.1 hypothetical protein, conserved [Eimeria tenella]
MAAFTASLPSATAAAAAEDDKVKMPYLFIDPGGERIPVLRHCSIDQSDAAAAAATAAGATTAAAESHEAAAQQASAEAAAGSDLSKGFAGIGVEDVGRFRLFSRERLLQLLPEGFAGEMHRDLLLIPSSSSPVGMMLRKTALELLLQLQHFADVQEALYGSSSSSSSSTSTGSSKAPRQQQQQAVATAPASYVLNYVATWARENGWLLLFEPFPSKFAADPTEIKRSAAGIYIQTAPAAGVERQLRDSRLTGVLLLLLLL